MYPLEPQFRPNSLQHQILEKVKSVLTRLYGMQETRGDTPSKQEDEEEESDEIATVT